MGSLKEGKREGEEEGGEERGSALEFRILVPAAVCPWPFGKPLCGTLFPFEKCVGGGEVLVGARVPQRQAMPTLKSGNSIWVQPRMKEGDSLGGSSVCGLFNLPVLPWKVGPVIPIRHLR